MASLSHRRNDNLINMYSSRAHVFQINDHKNSWNYKAEQAIPISLVATLVNDDSNQTNEQPNKRELKLIANNDYGETVLDVNILAKTAFTKRSQKFGQWVDFTDSEQTIYGLGFNSEAELDEFAETFQQLQRDIFTHSSFSQSHNQPLSTSSLHSTQPISQQAERSANRNQQQLVNNVSETNGRFSAGKVGVQNMQQYSNTLSHPSHHQAQIRRQQQQTQNAISNNGDLGNNIGENAASVASNTLGYPRSRSTLGLESKTDYNNNNGNNNNSSTKTAGKTSPGTEISNRSQSEWQIIERLRYENERLERALEESSKNSDIWHNELANLRTNNMKLTQALQESKSHVEEWERELLSLRGENKELRLQVSALESLSDPEKSNEYKNDLQKYKNYVDEFQSELRKKENEIDGLQKSMQELEIRAANSSTNGHFNDVSSMDVQKRQELEVIYAKFKSKLRGLIDVEKELEDFVTKKTL